MNIRRAIFGKQTIGVGSQGVAIADAGADQTVVFGGSVSLNGSSSSSTEGAINSYSWTYVSGSGFVIDSPSSAITTLSGTPTAGEHSFLLEVTDDLGNYSSDTVTITSLPDNNDPITFIGSEGNNIIISQGVPAEVLTVSLNIFPANYPDEVFFTNIMTAGPLDYQNQSTTGSITLDGLGSFTENLTSIGEGFFLEVIIVSRSSGETIPAEDRVILSL